MRAKPQTAREHLSGSRRQLKSFVVAASAEAMAVLAALLVLLLVASKAHAGAGPGGATCQTRPQPAARRHGKNVVHIVLDDLRPDLSVYNISFMHTPNIQRLADGGLTFAR